MTLFLSHLKQQLDAESPGWEENTQIILDNAPWHVTNELKARMAKLQLPIMYASPYSYTTAPAEYCFSALKLGDLNPDKLPTGKRYVTL